MKLMLIALPPTVTWLLRYISELLKQEGRSRKKKVWERGKKNSEFRRGFIFLETTHRVHIT